MRFVDRAVIDVEAGNGGRGCIAFRRERSVPFGGPSGGDGGRGGDVWLKVDIGATTLLDFRYRRHIRAENGQPGQGRCCHGRDGQDTILMVAPGTRVYDDETDFLLADLVVGGQDVCVCRGGQGGFGNRHFATSRDRAPRRADPGGLGETRRLRLELNVIADVGLIGLPNVGKSSLVRALTRSQTRVADYPFTTRHPNLAAFSEDPSKPDILLADLPGLIEGSAQGKGLGHRFLDHVSRCRILLHVLDASRLDPWQDYHQTRKELAARYKDGISKIEIIVCNKSDLLDQESQEKLKGDHNLLMVSATQGYGLDLVCQKLRSTFEKLKEESTTSWHPLS